MSKIIMTNGFKSMKEWADAGYPGAKSYPPEVEVQPDLRRGLCTYPGCDQVVHGSGSGILELCGKHVRALKQERDKVSA